MMPYKLLDYKRKKHDLTKTIWNDRLLYSMHTHEPSQKELITVKHFLMVYSISKSKFYSEVRERRLVIKKIGKRTYIKRIDAEAWLNALEGAK